MPNQLKKTPPLAHPEPLYYLHNFRSALRWLSSRYTDLLSAQEQSFIEHFTSLPLASQALLVRLIMRKGPHFRSSLLVYPEIGDIHCAAAPLLHLGWLTNNQLLNMEELAGLLRKQELAQLLPGSIVLQKTRKTQLVEQLQGMYLTDRTWSEWLPESTEEAYSLTISALCERLRLMFFGNLSQGWHEFVLADLGVFRYERVAVPEDSRGFTRSDQVDSYLHLHYCREMFDQGHSIESVLSELEGWRSDSLWLGHRHARLLFHLARQLEREGKSERALSIYQQSGWRGARHRQIRIFEKLQRYAEAYALVCCALTHPEDEAEEQLNQRAARRLARKLGESFEKPQSKPSTQEIQLVLRGPHPHGVEQSVIKHLAEPSAPVYYVENSLIPGLFGLLCWEAIFAPISGAFFHPFQRGPADLYSPDFHERRRDLFDQLLATLEDHKYRSVIKDTLRLKRGIQSPFINWTLLTDGLVSEALDCIPAAHLAAWFRRLLKDLRHNRAGMPDLIQFWPAQRSYRMIEVKGPGDKLQDNQLRWLAFCSQENMPVQVCHVQWEAP